MSGKNKGLPTKLKVCAPVSIYINCYGHLLYLALQKTMSEVKITRNALGITN